MACGHEHDYVEFKFTGLHLQAEVSEMTMGRCIAVVLTSALTRDTHNVEQPS